MANEYGNYTSVNALSPSDVTLSEANTKVVGVGGTPGGNAAIKGTMALFENAYFEAEFTASSGAGRARCGIATQDQNLLIFAGTTAGYCVLSDTSTVYHNGGTLFTQSPTDTVAVGDRIGWLMTDDGFKINIDGSNWNSGNEIATGLTPSDWFIGCGVDTTSEGVKFYFHETDWENKPSGALPISTANLPTPAVVNYEDEYYIEAGISHSNGSTTAVTLPKTVSGGAMARIKRTDSAGDWYVVDTVRGANKFFLWNDGAVEDTSTWSDQNLTGTTLTLPSALATGTYLIEVFFEGSYFDIDLNVGTGSAKAVAHSMGNDVGFGYWKNRETAGNGGIAYHASLGGTKWMFPPDTRAVTTSDVMFNDVDATSSAATVGTASNVNENTKNIVRYLWANSGPYAFGVIEGNGNANGSVANVGGLPASVMAKSVDSTSSWYVGNIKNNPDNPADQNMVTNTTGAIFTEADWDILSNGFKFRIATDPNVAETYIYGTFGIQPMTDGGVNQGRAR